MFGELLDVLRLLMLKPVGDVASDLRSDSTLLGDGEEEEEENERLQQRENGCLRDGGGMLFGVLGVDIAFVVSFQYKYVFLFLESRFSRRNLSDSAPLGAVSRISLLRTHHVYLCVFIFVVCVCVCVCVCVFLV